jgi:hypothetical protein
MLNSSLVKVKIAVAGIAGDQQPVLGIGAREVVIDHRARAVRGQGTDQDNFVVLAMEIVGQGLPEVASSFNGKHRFRQGRGRDGTSHLFPQLLAKATVGDREGKHAELQALRVKDDGLVLLFARVDANDKTIGDEFSFRLQRLVFHDTLRG